jgi:hypothetical protein
MYREKSDYGKLQEENIKEGEFYNENYTKNTSIFINRRDVFPNYK